MKTTRVAPLLRRLMSCFAMFVVAIPPSQGASESELRYSYVLVDQQRGQESVCAHMKEVFDRDFTALWNADPLWSENDARYAADSRYAFPRVPDVGHEGRKTFTMRFSKVPGSPEFDSVGWEEGRALIGIGSTPQPILIAHFDFDNDGVVDTVVKVGFNGGYDYVTFGGHVLAESLLVFRGQMIIPQGVVKLASLTDHVPEDHRPVIVNATYERPFLYKSRAYVARYDEDLGEDDDAGKRPPYRPLSETMSILTYHFSGSSEPLTGAPQWDAETVCKFSMSQVPSSTK